MWGNPSGQGPAWLRGLSRSQKFGLIPAFLDEIRIWPPNSAEYNAVNRSRYGLLAVHDIIPMTDAASEITWFEIIKKDFGITASDVNFKGFWEQTAVQPDNSNVKVSYYTRAQSALIFLTNMGEAYTGNVSIDISALGLNPAGVVITDAESKQSISISGGKINLSILRHDFKALQLVASTSTIPQGPAAPSLLLFK